MCIRSIGASLEHLLGAYNPVLVGQGEFLDEMLCQFRPEDELETPWQGEVSGWKVGLGAGHREERARQREQNVRWL